VLTGGVVVSGFVGACRPEGGGPCEGAASRELLATQRGQLLQVKRGQQAPQLLPGGANSPDLVSPPRPDEPVAKNGGVATEPTLDPKKSNSFDKLVQAQPVTPTPPTPTPPSPVEPPVVVPPVVEGPPERALQWGRWADLQGSPATAPFNGPEGSERIIGGNFVIFRTAGKDYVLPERGSVAFALKDSQAFIFNDNSAVAPVAAQLRNGQFNVDFGKAFFVTTFDLVSGSEVFKMMADGDVASDGRFGNTKYARQQTNNMAVDGFLSNANNGTAAYVFDRRLDNTRTTSGVTYWGH
jgi:hypothetical protein